MKRIKKLDALTTALTSNITTALPVIASIFAAIIGLVFLITLGKFIIKRVRGSVS